MSTATVDPATGRHFHHEAFFYGHDDEYVSGTLPFIRDGLSGGEAVLVVVNAARIATLRQRLGADADRVHFADMQQLGRNPARIIPAWRDFLDANVAAGRPVRGIGEPIWPGRTPAELDECHLHEALLNVAFDDGPAWSLLCPYDVAALDPEVVEVAHHTHPHVADHRNRRTSERYVGAPHHVERPLPPVPAHAAVLDIGGTSLKDLRRFVAEQAARWGLPAERTEHLVLAVCEVAGNTARHGAGRGWLRVWREHGSVICDVEDPAPDARFDPLVGRVRPSVDQVSGRGLWIANQSCDLVQIRAGADRTTVRVHVHLA